jgi:protein SCO1/2
MVRTALIALAWVLSLAAPTLAADAPALKAGVFSPPRMAPDFTLQGSDGKELKLSNLRGRVVVLGFGFTSCPDVCPITLATLAQAYKKLGAVAKDVQVVYITVDPARDDAQRMKQYLATFDPSFVGGTGSPERLEAVRKEYGVLAEKKQYGSNYTVAHSSSIYLIDREGLLRALMPYGRNPDDYVHDLQILARR